MATILIYDPPSMNPPPRTGEERDFTSRRQAIINAIAGKLKTINGQSPFNIDVEERVESRIEFWDEITEFPAINVVAGDESRKYQGGGYKDRYLNVTIRCYVNEEEPILALEGLLEDIETVIEENSRLIYFNKVGAPQSTQQISLVSITTDQGMLAPLGIGEIQCVVQY